MVGVEWALNKSNSDRTVLSIFYLSIGFMALFAASFLMMPVANGISLNEGKNGILYLVGIVFWLSFLLSQVMMITVSIKRKADKRYSKKKRLGLISFFSNREATIADILTAVFTAVFVICTLTTDSYLIYVFLCLAVLSFEMHCVLNGKNYAYIKELKSGGSV